MSTSIHSAGETYKILVFEGEERIGQVDALPHDREAIAALPEKIRKFIVDLFEKGDPVGYHRFSNEEGVVVAISRLQQSQQPRKPLEDDNKHRSFGIGFGDQK